MARSTLHTFSGQNWKRWQLALHLSPEAARSVLVLGFNHEAEMHHPTKFQQNQAVRGSFIDDSTNLRFYEGFCSS